MEKIKQPNKVICIYTNTKTHGKSEYAINLAAAIAKIAKTRVALLDISKAETDIARMLKFQEGQPYGTLLRSNIGIDVLSSERLTKDEVEKIEDEYGYAVINLSFAEDRLLYDLWGCFNSVHFFVDSTLESLKNAYRFLEDLLDKGLEDVHAKIRIVVNRLDIFDKFSVEDMAWLVRRNIWAVIPETGILESSIDAEGVPIILRSEDSSYSKAVFYIAKKEADKLLGLALGSGAAFGLAHIGVLKVLEQNRIPIDAISGSSIGALIASMMGLGFSSDKIERIAGKLRSKLNIMRLLDFSAPVSSILAGRRLKGFLRNILGEKTFEDLKIPVKIMVYDLANRETLVIEKGMLVEAVYMSISVPGIFKPTMEQERMIVDGGISDPVPVDILLKEGAKKVIAVNVTPSPEDVYARNMLLKKRFNEEENMFRTSPFYIKAGLRIKRFLKKLFTPSIFDVIMTSMQAMEYMLAENSCKKADVVLCPVLADATSVDFHLVKDFIRRGEEETILHIDEIRRLAER